MYVGQILQRGAITHQIGRPTTPENQNQNRHSPPLFPEQKERPRYPEEHFEPEPYFTRE